MLKYATQNFVFPFICNDFITYIEVFRTSENKIYANAPNRTLDIDIILQSGDTRSVSYVKQYKHQAYRRIL